MSLPPAIPKPLMRLPNTARISSSTRDELISYMKSKNPNLNPEYVASEASKLWEDALSYHSCDEAFCSVHEDPCFHYEGTCISCGISVASSCKSCGKPTTSSEEYCNHCNNRYECPTCGNELPIGKKCSSACIFDDF